MPELPDLVYIEKKLSSLVVNEEIRGVAVWEPIVLRIGVPGSFADLLWGKHIRGLRLHGPFLVIDIPPLEMIVHFMLAGYFRVDDLQIGKKQVLNRISREHCFSLELGDRQILHYFDSRNMSKIYVVEAGATGGIPGYDNQGVDLLSAEFTLQLFREKIKGRRQQVRVFLMDQSAFSAVGNAYADEILFAAGIHPKTRCDQLSERQVERLYRSVDSVLR